MPSCLGCKFLYGEGQGYSNYTWMDTDIRCALDLNPNLPSEEPGDWNEPDNWPKTMNSRCNRYAEGPYILLDVEGEDYPDEHTDDREQIVAIESHSGRRRGV